MVNMKKTIKSLTAKGYSQKKIAKTLHIRKQKVSTMQKTLKIGKRAPSEFMRDVKSKVRTEEITWKEAVKQVKKTPYWARKRLAKMPKKEREKVIAPSFWEKPKAPKEMLHGTFIEREGVEYYV